MIGQQVGKYKIIDELGRGGMGVVYRAEHTLMGKRAVVKVLLPQFSSHEEAVNRFFNEARAATSISHPGIVEVFDFGNHSDGRAYIVMELLTGETLAERRERLGKLDAQDALRIVRQVADALSAAHAKNIIHRDMKPDNVFLVPDREVAGGERAKVLDFGIAKLSDPNLKGLVETKAGAMIGTPTYMSPEQCEGASEVDARSDIYSVGCILYELLTGRTVFTSPGIGGMLAAHLTETPVPPSRLEPSVSPQVEALVMRLLAKNPNHRPQTMEALYREIDALTATSASMSGPAPGAHPGGSLQTTMPGTGSHGLMHATGPAHAQPRPGYGSHSGTGHGAHPAAGHPVPSSTLGVAAGQSMRAPAQASGSGRGILIAAAALVLLGGGAAGIYLAVAGGSSSGSGDTTDAGAVAELELDAEPSSGEGDAAVASVLPDASPDEVIESALDGAVAVVSIDAGAIEDPNEKIYERFKRAARKKDYDKVASLFDKLDRRSPLRARAKPTHDKLRDQFVANSVREAKRLAGRRECEKLSALARKVGAVWREAVAGVRAVNCTEDVRPEHERLNDEGEQLARQGKHVQALAKFREATKERSRSKYILNACKSLKALGRKRQAVNACKLVLRRGNASEKAIADRLIIEMQLED